MICITEWFIVHSYDAHTIQLCKYLRNPLKKMHSHVSSWTAIINQIIHGIRKKFIELINSKNEEERTCIRTKVSERVSHSLHL